MLVALVGAAIAVGCTSGSIVMNSRRSQAGAVPIERLLVLANLKSQGFSDAMYQGFSAALVGQLRACHVEPKLFHAEPGNDGWASAVTAEATAFAPSAMLLIRATGGVLHTRSGVTKAASIVIGLRIDATDTRAELWRAKLVFDVDTGSVWYDDTASGERLASLLVDQLRRDGVLDRCPAVAPGSAS
ncbi:MAG TPA: hypothetical protein VHT91_29815 [Kofleriaceae bacterium]|nr:hypothetical protein [Kofleriaceae bacterium]